MDQGLQNFLMKTSYLPAMTSRMAEELTGNVRAKRILAGSGQIEEAVGLLLDAQAWEKAVELILTQARGLTTIGRSLREQLLSMVGFR